MASVLAQFSASSGFVNIFGNEIQGDGRDQEDPSRLFIIAPLVLGYLILDDLWLTLPFVLSHTDEYFPGHRLVML